MVNTPTESSWTQEHAAHLLNRAGFGGTPEEIEKLHRLGFRRAVESLLAVEDDADLFPVPALTAPDQIFAYQREARAMPDGDEKRELQRKRRRQQGTEIRALRDWWLQRCRYTLYPLREKMTLFWHGHFATSFEKVYTSFLIWQQNETLRAYALGNFRKLTEEISRDPAMMRYLDLVRSEKGKPNENFARELMELFMLGEGVRYTEQDVQEAARAFTGYRIDPRTQQFLLARRRYDGGTKVFLEKTGNFDGSDIVDIVCEQPECADFMVRKIWNYLAGAPIPDTLAARLARDYQRSDFDTASLLRGIFLAPEFYAPTVMRRQVKSPVQWIVQTSRVLDAPLSPPAVNEQALRLMGQTLFAPPNVKGWEGGQSWINSSTFLLRCNLAGEMVHGSKKPEGGGGMAALKIPWNEIAPASLRADPVRLVDALSFRFINSSLSPEDRERFIAFAREHGTDDATMRDLVHLFLSTPEYQLT